MAAESVLLTFPSVLSFLPIGWLPSFLISFTWALEQPL
jgi:hypothetical protein